MKTKILLILLILTFFFYKYINIHDSFTKEKSVVVVNNKIRMNNHHLVTLAVGEFPPRYSQKYRDKSIFLEIISAAFKEVDIKVQYNFYPWIRVLDNAMNNIEDGSATWRKNEERMKAFHFSDPIYTSKTVAFHLKSKPFSWKSLKDFSGLRIGTTRSLFFGKKFSKMEKDKKFTLSRVTKDLQNYKMLLSKRIDLFLQQPDLTYYQMYSLLNESEYSQITHNPKVVYAFDLHLILSRKNEDNLRKMTLFNRGMKKIKDNGVFDKLMKKYIDLLRKH